MKDNIQEHIELCINSAEFLLDEFYHILALNEENKNKCSEKSGKNGIIYQINEKKGEKSNVENFRVE